MRLRIFALLPILATSVVAHAAALPVGAYTLTGVPGIGIHLSDPGTFGGTLIFNSASVLTFANLTFHDNLTSETDTFNLVGPTQTAGGFPNTLYATVTDSLNTAITYAFSIITPGNANGSFQLSCGVDCDTDINNSNTHFVEELTGNITPAATPEPASLVLLATGALAVAGAARRSVFHG